MFNRLTSTKNLLAIKDSLPITVHPVPAPFSTNELISSKISEGGNNQNEMLFNLGKAISGLPQWIGKK